LWSPDGKSLAYLSRELVVVIRSLDTDEDRELPLNRQLSYFFGLAWGADSKSLVISATDVRGRSGIFRVDAQSGQVGLIVEIGEGVNPGSLSQPVESPDGRYLYYRRSVRIPEGMGSRMTFVKRELATGREEELISRVNWPGPVHPSPDGGVIATSYTDASTKSTAVLLVPTGGGEPRTLWADAGPVMMWAPDGRSVFIRKGSELWRVPLAAGSPVRAEAVVDVSMGPFRVHPDGRQIVFQMNTPNTQETEIWALENALKANVDLR
jgi:dipeptidyl aminopeptidase/acylaminoacyl peptidase